MAKPMSRTDPTDDILEDDLPADPDKGSGGGSSPSTMPRSSRESDELAGGALSIMGMQPVMQLVKGMAELESLVKNLTKFVPALSTAAAPFIAQMRDLGSAALADLAQGGTGAVNLGADAPPPVLPGAPPAAGAPQGMGPGVGAPMMPPPPPM